MRVMVHVNTRFLGSGAERSVADVIHALPEVEHILVVGRDHNFERIRMLCGDVQVEVVANLIRAPNPYRDSLAIRDLSRLFRRLRPDLVHTIQSKSGILGRTAARRARVPIVVHSVVMSNFGPGFNPLLRQVYRSAEKLTARWTDQYIVNGRELRDRFVRAGIAPRERFELIRSSVDTGPFRAAAAAGRLTARAALSLAPNEPMVLFAGSLDHRKGAHQLPAYLAALRQRVPNANLIIAGEGNLRTQIEREFAHRGLSSSVAFLGFTSRLPEAMAAADCLVMLSSSEGLATVLLHAATSGTPFVSYDVDGPRELIDLGAEGAIVPIGRAEAAADRTAMLLGSPRRTPLALEEWAPDVVRQRYAAVLRPLLDRAAG